MLKRFPNSWGKNPHVVLACLLFVIGLGFLQTKVSTISGALFGAGATLLGAGIAEYNNKRSHTEDMARRAGEARKYLAPELKRTIKRVLYIHERAIPNFVSASVEHKRKPNDMREDFIPYMPVLYPNAPQFMNLEGDDATALIAFYDSLCTLDTFVCDWWNREGQLPVNIFNSIMTHAGESLDLAVICIKRFGLEEMHPSKNESWGMLLSRIERSKETAREAMKHHLARAEARKTI